MARAVPPAIKVVQKKATTSNLNKFFENVFIIDLLSLGL
jgi:hypothetical protein